MDSSSASKRPCPNSFKKPKFQRRRKQERARRASESVAEKEEWLRNKGSEIVPKEKPNAKSKREARLQRKILNTEIEQQREARLGRIPTKPLVITLEQHLLSSVQNYC
jgi:hypothetical protein